MQLTDMDDNTPRYTSLLTEELLMPNEIGYFCLSMSTWISILVTATGARVDH